MQYRPNEQQLYAELDIGRCQHWFWNNGSLRVRYAEHALSIVAVDQKARELPAAHISQFGVSKEDSAFVKHDGPKDD